MNTFYNSIDKRSRKSMVEYLQKHLRYNTMNSWNNSTSYASNLKVHHLGLKREIVDKLYGLIQTEEFYDPINDLIHEFGAAHNYQWQAGFNGRSGGYLALYQGERKPSGYKSYCSKCGQKNYKLVSESGNICGRCGKPARNDFTTTHMNINTFPGRDTDQGEDFENWDMDSLRCRVKLVQEFDLLADSIVAEAVYMAENYEVKEKTFYVPQTRKVMAGINI